MNQKPRVFISILSSLFFLIIYFLVYTLFYLLLGSAILLLLKVPIIKNILSWYFYREVGPQAFLPLICVFFCVTAILFLAEKMLKDSPTLGLSCILTGVFLCILHAVSLVINLVFGDPFWANIIQIIAGGILVKEGKDAL